jgi:osmotically-inducible protein OsmY
MGGRVLPFAAGATVGAGLAYFLDPDRGRARRNVAVDMIGARVRDTGRRLGREARYRGGQAEGVLQRARHRTPEQVEVDDVTLKQRVESEAFAPGDAPKGQVNVTVVDGVVELRGQVRRPEEIESLVSRVERVAGVAGVRSMLHLPDTPAPNKEQAREAG